MEALEDQELAFGHIMFEMLVGVQVSCPGGSWTSRSSASESSFGWRGRLWGLRPLASQIKSLRESVQCEKASGGGWSAEKHIQGPADGGGHAEGRGHGDSLQGRNQRGRRSAWSSGSGQSEGLKEEGEIRAPNPPETEQAREPGLRVWDSEVPGIIGGNSLYGAAGLGQMAVS